MSLPESNPFGAHERQYELELQEGWKLQIREFCETLAHLPQGSFVRYEWTKPLETAAFAGDTNDPLQGVDAADCYYSVVHIPLYDGVRGLNVQTITQVFGISMYDLVTYLRSGWFQLKTHGKLLDY